MFLAPFPSVLAAAGPALPKFVSAGTMVASTTGTISPGIPPGYQAGDIFLLFMESRVAQSPGSVSGYASVAQSPSNGKGPQSTELTCFWKRASGSESSPSLSVSGNHLVAVILAFRGCVSTGNPWDVLSTDVNSNTNTSFAVPGATTTIPQCLVVAAASRSSDVAGAQFSGWSNGSLTDLQERFDNGTADGDGGGIGIVTGIKATAGAYGSTAGTTASNAQNGMMSIALKP